MALWRLWPDGPGPTEPTQEDPNVTLGTEFEITEPGASLVGLEFWRADVATDGTITGRVWTTPGAVPVAGSDVTFDLSGTGRQAVTFAAVPLPEGRYTAGAHFPAGYSATPDYWNTGPGSAGITQGPLFAPSRAASQGGNHQGSFHYDAAIAYPDTGSVSGANFWVTPIISWSSPPPPGWPNSTNTGPAGGTVLTDYAGPQAIPAGSYNAVRFPALAPGLDYEAIGADTWSFTDCLFDGASVLAREGVFTFRRTEVVGGISVSSVSSALIDACDVHGFAGDGIHVTADVGPCGSVTIQESWVHDPAPTEGTEHCDAVQVRGCVGLVIDHNTLDMGEWFTVDGNNVLNAALFLENANGGNADVTVTDNYLNGAGYTLVIAPVTDALMTGNRWGTEAEFGEVDPVAGGVVVRAADNRLLVTDVPVENLPDAWTGSVTVPLAVHGSVTVVPPSGGNAPTSPVLCSAWATSADVPEPYRDLVGPDLLLRASEILWALSGRRWYGSGCTETVTYRAYPPGQGQGSWPYDRTWGRCPCWIGGHVADGWLYPPRAWEREHYRPAAIRLPRNLVQVIEVRIDGALFTDWRMSRSGWLERTDGETWSGCDDSTTITYNYGEPPPRSGVDAAVELAVEMYRDSIADGTCRLPARLSTVTRQGLTMTALDGMDFLDKGRTGLYLVDLFLAAVNPHGRGQAGSVWSPDIPKARR